MGRGRALGLVVAGMAMLGVWAAPAASAALPQWHHCAKASPKNTGSFTDKNCTVASLPGQGKYEILSGVGKKPLKGKATETRIIVAVPLGIEVHIDCGKASFTGHPVAPSGISQARLSFSKCSWQGGTCDTIQTEPLSGKLGWLDQSTGTAGLSLTSEKTPGSGVIANVNCEEGVKFRITGAFIAGLGPSGALTTEHTLNYQTGEYIGEPSPGDKPIVNPPAFEEEFVGTLQTEISSPETEFEFTPEGGIPSGLEGNFALTGEALGIS